MSEAGAARLHDTAAGAVRRFAGRARPTPPIGAIILFAGGVRRNELVQSCGRSRLDLPLDADTTILGQWQSAAGDWAGVAPGPPPRLRVLVDPNSPPPQSVDPAVVAAPSIECDPQECRGTGGLLHDLAQDYDDDHWLLVASGAQVLLEPFPAIVHALTAMDGDVRLIAHRDGAPVGMMLVRCGCLRCLDQMGFIDFKEQGLPRIAKRHRIRVLQREHAGGVTVTNARNYLSALRRHHLRRRGVPPCGDAFAEDWRSVFNVVEPAARVAPDARLHDTVVMRGAHVDRGAIVVRSLVCPGARVGRGKVITDQVVCADARAANRFRSCP